MKFEDLENHMVLDGPDAPWMPDEPQATYVSFSNDDPDACDYEYGDE